MTPREVLAIWAAIKLHWSIPFHRRSGSYGHGSHIRVACRAAGNRSDG